MAELIFDRQENSTPFDRAGELTEWRAVGAAPIAKEGQRFPSRQFKPGFGFRGVDDGGLFGGLKGIYAHFVVAPNYVELDGAGRAALLYRGHGGPTAAQFWAWGIELDVSGTTVDVYSVHQNSVGTFISQLAGTYTAGAEWVALAVSREIVDEDQFMARAWLDGASIGSNTATSSTAATPGEPVTLGVRIVAAETGERFFEGLIERVLVSGEAATDAQVRHDYQALVGAFEESGATVSTYYNRQAFNVQRDAAYWKYRVRPGAEIQTLLDAAILRGREALLPPSAYGSHLRAFEAALSLRPSATDSIASRQATTQAALAGGQELSSEALQQLAATLFGVPAIDVTILEGANYTDIPVVGSGELTGPPWRVQGAADVTNEVAGLTIHVPSGRDLRHEFLGIKSVFIELGIDHLREREVDHGLAVTFDIAVGLSLDVWTGLVLVEPNGKIWWIVLDSGGLALRSFDPDTGLAARTLIAGAVAAPVELVIEWIPIPLISAPIIATGRWDIRWRDPGTGPGNWTETSLDDPIGAVTWMGIAAASAVAATLADLDIEIGQVIAKAGDASSWAYWQALDTDPVNRDIVAHSRLLDDAGRAVSRGSATHEPELFADTDGSVWTFTPTILFGPRVGHIGADASQAAQMTGVFPSNLWTMQDAGAPVLDVVGLDDLSEVAPAPTYQAAGPVDRFAIEFAANGNRLETATNGILDAGGATIFLACILRITGNGVIWGKEQTAAIGWVLAKNLGNMTLRQSDGISTITAALTDAASGFVVDQWFALTALVEDAAGTARVVLATSQSSATSSQVFVSSNTGKFGLGGGQSGNSAVHRQRWFHATDSGEAIGLTPTDVANSATRLAAAAGVA